MVIYTIPTEVDKVLSWASIYPQLTGLSLKELEGLIKVLQATDIKLFSLSPYDQRHRNLESIKAIREVIEAYLISVEADYIYLLIS